MPYFDTAPVLRACYRGDELIMTLRRNLGKVCTIHVPGEPSPLGITGIVSEVDNRACKLISLGDTPSPRRSDCEEPRRIHTIPLDKITYIDTAQY